MTKQSHGGKVGAKHALGVDAKSSALVSGTLPLEEVRLLLDSVMNKEVRARFFLRRVSRESQQPLKCVKSVRLHQHTCRDLHAAKTNLKNAPQMNIDDGTPLYRIAMLALAALSKDPGPESHDPQRVVQCMKFTVLLGVIYAAWEEGGSDAQLDKKRVKRLVQTDGMRKKGAIS